MLFAVAVNVPAPNIPFSPPPSLYHKNACPTAGEGMTCPFKWVPTNKFTDLNLKLFILFPVIFKNLNSNQF